MKPFDLEKAIEGHPIQLAGGLPMFFVGINPTRKDFPVIVSNAAGKLYVYRLDGSTPIDCGERKLVMKTKPRTVYANIHIPNVNLDVQLKGGMKVTTYLYATKEEAQENAATFCGNFAIPIEIVT